MAGSSIAGRDAAPWVTDFLNAAYYRRPADEREVDDLRLAFSVLTTYWYRRGLRRRLHVADLPAFHRAFGADRFDTDALGPRHAEPRAAARRRSRLLGEWFPGAYADDARRGWGVAFDDGGGARRLRAGRRLALAQGRPAHARAAPPGRAGLAHVPAGGDAVGRGRRRALVRPETWPDYASRSAASRRCAPGGLAGQTFEIEVAAGTDPGRPIFIRGYVTITRLVTPDDPDGAGRVVRRARGRDGALRQGRAARRARGREPVVGFDLTTHRGHFMGAGHNRLVLYDRTTERPGSRPPGPGTRCRGTSSRPTSVAGRDAQHAFWGQGDDAAKSMLHQLALRIADAPRGRRRQRPERPGRCHPSRRGRPRGPVLEAADAPGGAVQTAELTLPGFRHDVFAAVFPAGAASPVFARMPLADHGLRWTHPEACYAHPLPGGEGVALYRDLDRTAAGLDELSAGDGARWRAFAAPLLAEFDAVRATMLGGFPPVRGPWALLRGLGPVGAARFGLLLPDSAARLGARLFRSDAARAWLYGSAGHGDVPPTGPGSAIAVAYLNLLGHAVGWPSPAGGAGALTDALVPTCVRSAASCARRARHPDRQPRRARRGVALAGGDASTRSGHRRRHAPRPRPARGRRAAGAYRRLLRALSLRPRHGEGRLGPRRPDPVGLCGGARRRHGARRRPAGGARRDGPGRRARAAGPAVPAPGPAVDRRPVARAGRVPHRLGVHARPGAGHGLAEPSSTATSSVWRRRWSATRPASATGSSPAT